MTQRSNTDERKRPIFSASNVIEAVAADLSAIKLKDDLTDADIAAILGKSEDQAEKYRKAAATMDIVTYARGKREWNGRFTGRLDKLCEESRPCADTDRARHSKLLRAALAVAEALEDDDDVSPEEVKINRRELEEARDAIDALLRKIVRAA